jgi:hypothetical protein
MTILRATLAEVRHEQPAADRSTTETEPRRNPVGSTDQPSAKHTPGPWRWELNESGKNLSLVGGRPEFDLTIIEPTRWGMGSATLMIRDTAHDGMNIMHKLHERRDWIAPFAGRAHHADWCAGVTHPDMRLIAAAPAMLLALRRAVIALAFAAENSAAMRDDYLAVSDAIAKATGESLDIQPAPALHPGGAAGAHLAAVTAGKCACRTCMRERDDRDASGWPILLGTMVVCLECGNKRCPKAESHDHACTGSNEVGQVGSAA